MMNLNKSQAAHLSGLLIWSSSLAVMAMLAGCGGRSLVAVRDSAARSYERGDYPAAIEDYKEYIDRSPGNAFVYHDLGRTYLAAGQTGLARENLLLAHSLRVEDDEIFASTCEGLYQDKRLEELNRLLRARTIDRGRMRDFLLLGSFSERQGDVDEAQRAYLTAAQVDAGTSWQPHLALAKLYKRVGDTARYRQRLSMAAWAGPGEREVIEEVRISGSIPGPTFGVVPPEAGGAALPLPTTPLPKLPKLPEVSTPSVVPLKPAAKPKP